MRVLWYLFVVFSSFLCATEFLPLLPLYPDERISLSKENERYLESYEFQEREKERYEHLFSKRSKFYTLILLALCIPIAALILFWMFIEYNVGERLYTWLIPKEDRVSAIIARLHNPTLKSDEKWQLVSLLVRAKISEFEHESYMNMTNPDLAHHIEKSSAIPIHIKRPLEAIVSKLDLYCFAPHTHDEEAWQIDKNFLIDINSSNTHCSDK